MDVLERTFRMATSPAAREHVTYHIYKEAPELHVLRSYEAADDFSQLSWTVDTPEDFARVSGLIERCADALRHLNPEAVLERGFAIVTTAQDTVVQSADALRIGESLKVRFARGAARATVTGKE